MYRIYYKIAIFEVLLIVFVLILVINAKVAKTVASFLILKVLNIYIYNNFFVTIVISSFNKVLLLILKFFLFFGYCISFNNQNTKVFFWFFLFFITIFLFFKFFERFLYCYIISLAIKLQ